MRLFQGTMHCFSISSQALPDEGLAEKLKGWLTLWE